MILSVVGDSKSGKTTIVTKLVSTLKSKGLRVAVVKHTHGFEIDKEGKDSWKIYESGADVIISSKDKLALIRRQDKEDFDEICYRYLRDYDVVITEGFNDAGKDRIVVLNSKSNLERYKKGKIIAVVSDTPINGYVYFKKDQQDELLRFVLDYLNVE
ncbi:molybdopterin-guanine dinucleotide biosynthesis protein B [Archaeoglobales archaeon]|nr:MAG: molybdopterin-guanine dinucleotide biosynthesis protein B [Archaeoglobales archaeon]